MTTEKGRDRSRPFVFVDGRVKPGHDDGESDRLSSKRASAARPATT
jgi:hypothetical protein